MNVCVYCFQRGRYNVPATGVVVTASGINTACGQCAEELADAQAAAWDADAAAAIEAYEEDEAL